MDPPSHRQTAYAAMLQLEAQLLAFLRPDETAAELLARTYVEPFFTGVPLIDHHISFRPGNVLEIAGSAGTGKTEMLVQIAATCILPATLHGVHFGGRGENVLIFDLDCKFDGLRILQVLHTRIGHTLSCFRQQFQDAKIQAVVQDSLQRLHLVRCHSSFDLLASLAVAKPLMTRLSALGGIRCVLIDNIAAFHYLDKVGRGPGAALANIGLGQHDVAREGAPLTLHRVQAAVAEQLRLMAREHRVAVVATKHLLFQGGGREAAERGDAWAQRDVMLRPWQELVSHRLALRSVPSSRGGQQEQQGAGETRLAKWMDPHEDTVMRFEITDGPLILA